MNYLYGWDWHELLREPTRPMTEKQARQSWDKGTQITVCAFEGETEDAVPAYTLSTSGQGQDVHVRRFDDAGSCVRSWDYERRGDRLFLEEDTRWTYADEDEVHELDEAEQIRFVLFRDDGSADVGFTPEDSGPAGTRTGLDLSTNWLATLDWGDWDRVGLHEPRALADDESEG